MHVLPEIVRRHILERNAVLGGRHRGERCFILVDGPAIKNLDLEPLKDEICITVSTIPVHFDFACIKPRYHCLPTFRPSITEAVWDDWIRSFTTALQLCHPDTVLLCPLADIKRNNRSSTPVEAETYYLDFSASPDFLLRQGIDLTQPVSGSQTAPVMALQAAVYMGFKDIYLLGHDHDWLVPLNISQDVDHQDAHGASVHDSRDRERHDGGLEKDGHSYLQLVQQYQAIRQAAARSGIAILNAAEGTLLDVFPRVAFGDLFADAALAAAPFQRKSNEYGFFGDFSTWAEAVQYAGRYDAPLIFERVKEAALQVKSGKAAYERDTVVFDTIPYEWIAPLAYWLPQIASEYDQALNLIDFGGSLGSTYFALRGYLAGVRELKWNIVEQAHFVEYGNAAISDSCLRFFSSMSECVQHQKPSIVLLSAVLEYLEKPYGFIEELLAYNFDYIIFDRTPFIAGDHDRLTVQFVSPEIYEASYPAWFFSKKKFLRLFTGQYEIVAGFSAQDSVNIPSTFEGFVFKRIAPKPAEASTADAAEWAHYNELGDFIRRIDTPANKQHFLADGCQTGEQQKELRTHRTVNSCLSEFSARHQLITIKNKPTYAIFEMSNRCNLHCSLCNTGAMRPHFPGVERGTMRFETFKAGLDKLLPEIESILLYNWGEPLLNNDLFRCIEYAKGYHVRTQLSTNMMLYTEETGLHLIQSGLDKLIVSCDGLDQATYQKYRSGGDLAKVVTSVENIILQKRRMRTLHPHIEMQCIVFAFNEHQMQPYEQFWLSKGVDTVNFIKMSYMSSYGRAKAQNNGYIPSHQDFQPHFPYGAMKSCSEPYNHVTIDWNGDWYTCCFPSGMREYRIGNIVTDDFWEIWNGEKYRYCRALLKNQISGDGYCETICHDCTGVFPSRDTKRYWLQETE